MMRSFQSIPKAANNSDIISFSDNASLRYFECETRRPRLLSEPYITYGERLGSSGRQRIAPKLRKLDDEADNKCEDGQCISNCDSDKHRRRDLTCCLWVPANCFKSAADQDTETNTGAEHADTDDERHTECLCYFNVHTEFLRF